MNRRQIDANKRDPWSVVYAAQGSDGFNARLHGVLRDLTRDTLAAVGDPLVAVVVTGAYGDGRGRCIPSISGPGSGIWSHGQAPGDEVELLVVANANRRVIRRLLAPVCRKYSAILNVEVHFTLIWDEMQLLQLRPSFRWYELVQSHQLLFGSESIFASLKQRYGLVEDACARPRFPIGEAIWMLCHTAFLALEYFHDVQESGVRHFFSLTRHLGDILLLQADSWDIDVDQRNTEILQLLSDHEWFKKHTEAALSLHELYRESVSFFSAEPSKSISKDWPAFIQGWLLVDEYLSSFPPEVLGVGSILSLWHGLLRHRIRHLQFESIKIRNNFFWPLLRRLATWYYQVH